MIQDIKPHHLYNEYTMRREPSATDALIVCQNGKILLKKEENGFSLPRIADLPAEAFPLTETTGENTYGPCALRFVLTLDQMALYLWENPDDAWLREKCENGFSAEKMATLRTLQPQEISYAAVTACHLADWYYRTRYCGVCGTKMEHSRTERAMVCPACRNTVYPRISPGVIVRVTHGDKVLLTKYAGREFTNYALVAGFTEIGETLEETVQREVMEEVGLPVKNIRYYKNQPWAFSQSLLVGFTCELDGDDEDITLEEDELSVGVWMTREEMPARTADISLTAEMMENFRLGRG